MMNLFNALVQWALNPQHRALQIQFSNTALDSQVFLQRIEGCHALNEGLSAELLCFSHNPYIALKQFIGCQVVVVQLTDTGLWHRTSGIITAASAGDGDGALTPYTLTVQDPTSLWHKRRNSRVFMNKSVPDISQILFKEWQTKSPLFAATLSLDVQGLAQNYDIRPFVMQANESDYDFLTRLWRSEGINWLIDETHYLSPVASGLEPQILRLIDDNRHYLALQRQIIDYHQSSAVEPYDHITHLTAVRSLQPTAVHVQHWQAQHLETETGAGSVLSTQQHSAQHSTASLSLEQAWAISPAWVADLNGEDGVTPSGNAQLEKLNRNLREQHDSQAKQFTALSSVRDAQVGYWFMLARHPEVDLHPLTDREFLISAKQFYHHNNLPKDLKQHVSSLLTQNHWQDSQQQPNKPKNHKTDQERQGNQLTLIRRAIPPKPDYNPLQHRPVAYPQRARVVGPASETIHVDAWGRIKLQFLFTRMEDHQHSGGAGSSNTDQDSAWVDVLTPWAGEGYGARFLPRIGEMVVVDFFDGNVDRPFVSGRIHEAERHPTRFDQKGNLPDTKRLSGIRSQEIGGSGFNQLRFDDTTGQISAQLHSSHGASQLNLGNLSHPKESETSAGRGEGFELRTDQYGAVRAGKGLLISTYAQEQAVSDHLAAAEAQSLLKQGHDSMQALSEVAAKQQADALDVIHRLPRFIESLELKSAGQALSATVNLFKNSLSTNPLMALKDCGGFIDDVGSIQDNVGGVVEEFKSYFNNASEAVDNLKGFIETLENHGTAAITDKLSSLKQNIKANPLQTLKDVGAVLKDIDVNSADFINVCGSFGGGGATDITPTKALGHLQGFMEGYTQKLEQSKDSSEQEQGKIFRQALMLLASPNGIALTTPENIILQASQDISSSASGSINLSSQQNIIGHAQAKISLFAAQKGIKAFAAKGKIELQAQDDALEAIARKVIKLISTEDKIELTSPKEIVLTAGGSQLIINGSGVFIKTGGKFECKAGQHVFSGGAKVSYEIPELPSSGPFTKAFHFVSLEGKKIENAVIQVYEKINENYSFKIGSKIDKSFFKLENDEKNIEYKVLVGFDEWVSWFEEEKEEYELEEEIDLGEHHNPFDKESGSQHD
ncbi:MAG: type VI secretion system tip protein VgrG [Moraxellaceae bacterium]|nr:MAG: type VI secretion system tip protein VgrG [Moraxellaceae bacterium]